MALGPRALMLPDALAQLPAWINLALYAAAATGVWIAGTRLSLYADAIADRLRIGKGLMGLVFLASATSLPEGVTTITAAVSNEPSLLVNGLLGGMVVQLAILAIADASVPSAALTQFPRTPSPALEGTLLVLLLAMVLGVVAIGEAELVWNVGVGAVVLAIAYVIVIALLRRYEADTGWIPVEIPEDEVVPLTGTTARELDAVPLPRLMWRTADASLLILVCGVATVQLAAVLAGQTGLGEGFIGATLLATSNSLPELSTTIAAARLGAYTMAISNIFGSNLIMMALLLPADLLYRQGLLLAHVERTGSFALLVAIMMASVYVAGLLIRRKRRILGMGADSLIVLALYGASLVIFYTVR